MHGFREYQYDMLRQKCVEAGYFLAISNPCFEVWLLFHYSDLTEYDHQMILAHKKLANVPKQRYISKISWKEVTARQGSSFQPSFLVGLSWP